ncbi:nucleotide exchange factor GrpE [Rhodohalobacter mucosus]|uniref:Protein GrpE n=2 Tax=Rhodohalobacter mucosus TaxID=2079485 RepID=A0A316TW13_9BACT|nr:nucleotide exchange factor GrpE [Rhodohalobacter mucosus]
MSTEQEKEQDQDQKQDMKGRNRFRRAESHEAEVAPEESDMDASTQTDQETDEILLEQQQKINELEAELQEVKDNQLRKAAEMENFRKRLLRDRDQMSRMAKETAVEAFLPVYDDLLRTIEALDNADAGKAYLEGIRLVANKFEEVLHHFNVEKIDETGVPFDVDLHDAMMRQKPEDDSIESGTVLQVFENGYKMGDKTLRHAKVIVSE